MRGSVFRMLDVSGLMRPVRAGCDGTLRHPCVIDRTPATSESGGFRLRSGYHV